MRKGFIARILRGVKTVLTFLPSGGPFVPLQHGRALSTKGDNSQVSRAGSCAITTGSLLRPLALPMLSLLSTPVALLEEAFRLADSAALFSFHFDKEMAQGLPWCLEKMAARIGSGSAMADSANFSSILGSSLVKSQMGNFLRNTIFFLLLPRTI